MRLAAAIATLAVGIAALPALAQQPEQPEQQVPKLDVTPRETDPVEGVLDTMDTPVNPLEDTRIQPVINTTYVEECGGCHVPYQPALQTADAWKAILDALPDHFGASTVEVAPPGDLVEIAEYLRRYAGRPGYGVLVGVDADASPLRITELPYFAKAHATVPPQAFENAGGKWRCQACHEQAGRGFYRDALPEGLMPD